VDDAIGGARNRLLGHQDCQVVVGQDARGGGADSARRLLGRIEQVLQSLVGTVGLDPDDARIEHLVDDRREVLLGEDGLAFGIEDHGVGGRQVDEADVVAVGLLAHHLGPAHLPPGAALVDDDDGLAELLLGEGGDDAGGDVGRAARGEGHHQLDGPVGKILRRGAGDAQGECRGDAGDGRCET
jgi:hypothetical protein